MEYTVTQKGRELPDHIALVVIDFDGVLTDDRVLVDQNGTEAVFCCRADGLGIALLSRLGIQSIIMSSETNPVVNVRARKLGIEAIMGLGLKGKADALKRLLAQRNLKSDQVIYVGNDINDVPCFEHVACALTPVDAHQDALDAADLVLTRKGGHGVIREMADLIRTHMNAELC